MYVPRGPTTLTHIFHDHFQDFPLSYDSLYAKDYGMFPLERISRVVVRFESCGDYTKGIAPWAGNRTARIQCSNPSGGSRACTAGASKSLRIFFRHDQKLFASVSALIFSLIRQFYRLAAGSPLLKTACVIAFQPFGDFLRANAHWHAIVLEGGFTPDGKFMFLPIHDTQKLKRCLPPCRHQTSALQIPDHRGVRLNPLVLEKLGFLCRQ